MQKKMNCEIILPIDIVVAKEFAANTNCETLPADACPADSMILDAGSQTIKLIHEHLKHTKTVIWNGLALKCQIEGKVTFKRRK